MERRYQNFDSEYFIHLFPPFCGVISRHLSLLFPCNRNELLISLFLSLSHSLSLFPFRPVRHVLQATLHMRLKTIAKVTYAIYRHAATDINSTVYFRNAAYIGDRDGRGPPCDRRWPWIDASKEYHLNKWENPAATRKRNPILIGGVNCVVQRKQGSWINFRYIQSLNNSNAITIWCAIFATRKWKNWLLYYSRISAATILGWQLGFILSISLVT